jgi:NADPH:quinone reductase-like Zn-dependent oxidoreductase
MKAIVCDRYGDPDSLRLEDVDRPTPGVGQVLLRVGAASLNALDWHLMEGRPPVVRLFTGLRRPNHRPGRDVAGRVEAIGPGVSRFKPGDDVFGVCRGSLAEYACAPESAVVPKPPGVSFEDAAAAPIATLTAMQGLRDHGRIRAGQKVLINGAAGGVGTFAVQIARTFGADVAGVCSARNVAMVRSIGAGRVYDYALEDFTRSGERYDLIYDLVANHSISEYRRVLTPGGVIVFAGGGGSDGRGMGGRLVRTFAGAAIWKLAGQKLAFYVARLLLDDLVAMGRLIASARVKPIIDSRHPLSEASRAMRTLSEGHARGKVMVTVDKDL